MSRRTAIVRHLSRVADLRLLLLALAFLAVLIALDHPRIERKRPVFRYIFVLDITASMNVRDVVSHRRPFTRLELARTATQRVLARLPCGSEAGLALFTERRAFLLFTPVEVCRHLGNVSAILDTIDPRLAWRARSEIARGLNSSLRWTAALDRPTRLVFVTDGHEAPPINPDFAIPIDPAASDVSGLIVGVGGDVPVPIPLFDHTGAVAGFWSADDVQQVDSLSLGRRSSGGEPMVGVDARDIEQRIARGTEHLSSVRETYLTRLAEESGLDYVRLDSVAGLVGPLTNRALGERESLASDVHWLASLLAALCVLVAVTGHPSAVKA